MDKRTPVGTWACYLSGGFVGLARTRRIAMNLIERPRYRRGNALVVNQKTGERWKRRAGSWFKDQDAWRARRAKAKASGEHAKPNKEAPRYWSQDELE